MWRLRTVHEPTRIRWTKYWLFAAHTGQLPIFVLTASENSKFGSLPRCFTSSQSPPRSTKSSNWFNGFWQCNTDPGEVLCPFERWRKLCTTNKKTFRAICQLGQQPEGKAMFKSKFGHELGAMKENIFTIVKLVTCLLKPYMFEGGCEP